MPRTGRPPADNPKSKRVTARVDEATLLKVQAYCKEKGIDQASVVRLALERLMEETVK